jgi:hypothetical protein
MISNASGNVASSHSQGSSLRVYKGGVNTLEYQNIVFVMAGYIMNTIPSLSHNPEPKLQYGHGNGVSDGAYILWVSPRGV